MPERLPRVAIVGRPNVGKSTLFNRLIGRRQAITDDMPGVTRDLIYGDTVWNGRDFTLIDTGGYDLTATDEIGLSVLENARAAANQASVIILMVDGLAGMTGGDEDILTEIRKRGIPVILAVNKIDNAEREVLMADFYQTGIDPVVPVSAAHGLGTGDLLDELVERLPAPGELPPPPEKEPIRIAIVGRPNVGKSTLLNRLCGEERSIVTSVAGTTRDPVDTLVEHKGREYVLVDTAGIRRAGKIRDQVERFSVMRAKRAIERCDVVLMVMDAEEGVTETDARVFSMADEMGRAAILCVNKWDSVEKETGTAEKFTKDVREVLMFLRRAPVLFLSAQTGQRVQKIFPLVEKVFENASRRIPTAEVNKLLEELLVKNPPSVNGKLPHIQYATQARSRPPTFILFCRDPRFVPESWKRFFVNQVYDRYEFEGAPVQLRVRSTSRKSSRRSPAG